MMLILAFLLFSINPPAIRQAPAGTEVHVRLTTALIPPEMVDGETVLPAGPRVNLSPLAVTSLSMRRRYTS
jgi:hypothetical protein